MPGASLASRALVLGLVASTWASAQRSSFPSAQPGSLERAFAGPRTPLELRRRLGSLEASEIPRLFQLAAEARLADRETGSVTEIDEVERQIVRESLVARPRREIVPFLSDLAARPLAEEERLEAQRLLGGMGSADHVKLLARLTMAAHERGPARPALRAGFTAALGAILARDPAALPQVPLLLSECPPGLASSIVEALSGSSSGTATRMLAGLLGRSPGLDPLLLARLAERGRPRESDREAVFDAVRRYLRQRDPALISAAALACGRLGDDGAVDALVQLVDHADARARESAVDALERISGLAFGCESERWTSWYRDEMRWWDEEADSLLLRIERGRGQDFVRAAREVLEHRLFRDRMAESFERALSRGSAEEVRLACRALEQLRAPGTVQGLVECLERDDPLVREAAWKALRAITGVELPPESDSWAELAG